MVSRPEVLAVVQARGGSKGLPRKNLRSLKGHPLVAYSIASGLAARSVTRVIMSTDDEEIAEVAKHYGAEVPFLRPAELAHDDTPDFPLFDHALGWLKANEGYRPTAVVQLRPTTPLRPCGMIDEAVTMLLADLSADCVRGMTVPKQTPYKMWRAGDDGYALPLMQGEFVEPYNMPRQQLPTTYWQTGHVDVIRSETITNLKSLTGRRVRSLIIDGDYCVDIDSLADFDLAERTIAQKNLQIDLPYPTSQATESRSLPKEVALLVFDFDGVFTDNRVLVFDDGREAVACNRGDGMGLEMLRTTGVPVVVVSTEKNPVVAARCRKLGLEYQQGLEDKSRALREFAAGRNLDLQRTIYVGNDLNDLGCMNIVGFSVAVADAHPTVRTQADLVLSNAGGYGAVREICEAIIKHLGGIVKYGASH